MSLIKIHGPHRPLHGPIPWQGSKNVSMPYLVAAALCPGGASVEGVPRIRDTQALLSLLGACGATSMSQGSTVMFQPLSARSDTGRHIAFPQHVTATLRGAVYALALPACFGWTASMARIGGDRISTRSLEPHCRALRAFGLDIRHQDNSIDILGGRARAAKFSIDDKGITATSMAILIAASLDGQSVIQSASLEIECDDVLQAVASLGASAHRDGRTLVIRGPLAPLERVLRVPPDHLVWGTYAIAAAMSGGSTRSTIAPSPRFTPVTNMLQSAGLTVTTLDGGLCTSGYPAHSFNIRTGMYPDFPSDLLPQAAALAAVCPGTSKLTESHYGARFDHLPGMSRLGVALTVENDTIVIRGPADLLGTCVQGAGIRETAALALIALAAKGESTIVKAESLARGYEDFAGTLRSMGADVRMEG